MGQMTAVGKIHAEHHIAGLQHGEIDRRVGLRAAMRLDIGVVGVKKLFGAVAGNVFGYVHILAAAVITTSRITLGVFIGQRGAHGLQNRRRNKIFRSDEFYMGALTFHFVRNSLKNFGIHFLQVPVIHLYASLYGQIDIENRVHSS